jgi:hypothetical protein
MTIAIAVSVYRSIILPKGAIYMNIQELTGVLTIVMPSVTAIVAILVPLIIEKKRSESELKLKQLEILYDKKLEIYKEFADSYGRMHENRSMDDYHRFRGAANKAAVLSEPQCRNAIFNLLDKVDLFNGSTNQDTDIKFQACIGMLYRQIIRDESKVRVFSRTGSEKRSEGPNVSAGS